MTLSALMARGESQCELCGASEGLLEFAVAPHAEGTVETSVLVCPTCQAQMDGADADLDVNHWRCLNDSMWSQVPAVQVVAWRMLNRLRSEGWAQDAIDMLYLDEEALAWAQDGQSSADAAGDVVHKDVNGTVLEAGDTVTLIKDLKVKGGGFTAKRGTAVRGISLVPDDPKHIEGRVSGQQIVIIAEYVKKS